MCLMLDTVAGSCVCLTGIAKKKSSVPIASNTYDMILGFPPNFRNLKLFKGIVNAVV